MSWRKLRKLSYYTEQQFSSAICGELLGEFPLDASWASLASDLPLTESAMPNSGHHGKIHYYLGDIKDLPRRIAARREDNPITLIDCQDLL